MSLFGNKKASGPRWYIKAEQDGADIKKWVRSQDIVGAVESFQDDFPDAAVISVEREYEWPY